LADALGLEEVRGALAEDRAAEDVTTRLLGAAADRSAVAHFVTEGRFVVAGLPIVDIVFRELDPAA
jgi:nicotinate-nucleotide pyrophosphorylase